ncbi:alpha/beta hydrolase [Virgisporangium aurantiacum]|uniref:Peptidase n=1 Tax=Virgisporangium aurantiacum TaxID=175570 RepID=A0A8J4E0I1_9ACTN|nr:alpha/beta hydrolase [Virgisporangium aurantiacum]GIJ57730.1 peptidase [Virgisporangium aurantiacum]
MRKPKWSLLVGMVVVTGAVIMPVSASAAEVADVAGVSGYEVPAVNWQPCPTRPEVECGTVAVPLDWSAPRGAKTYVGIARIKAKDPANRLGALVFDPGGPGGSGVDYVLNGNRITAPVAQRFDVIGFDPRGVNTSQKLLCDNTVYNDMRAAKRPTSQAEFDKLAGLNRQFIKTCRDHSGSLVDHLDTRTTARDIDAVRAALGEAKLNYLGFSYGTLMGQQYAEMFPTRIRAMVNDGNMDHSLPSAFDFMIDQTAPVEQNFLEFAQWCDTTPACALYGQDTRKTYGTLRERAKAGTLTDPATGQPVDFYALANLAFNSGRPPEWHNVANSLKALRDGNGAVTASMRAPVELVNDIFTGVWCSDWNYPIKDFVEYNSMRTELARRFPNMQWSPYVDNVMTCIGEPLPTTNPQRPLKITGAPPLVMIGNIHDYATVYKWNRTAAAQSGSHLITYEGWYHTAYGPTKPSQCINGAVEAYLLNLTVPKAGLSCPAMEKPTTSNLTADATTVGSY